MLTEERRAQIIKVVEDTGSASVQELMGMFDASESTIRRDLTELAKKGLLTKVHGGAIAKEGSIMIMDASIAERSDLNKDNKLKIAMHAASLIEDDDIIFIDAGTTTAMMIEYISAKDVTVVTTGVHHARLLSAKGITVYMPGGQLKNTTEALVGTDTCDFIRRMYFTKCFIGGNGIHIKYGITTPDKQESAVKELALLNSRDRYVIADSSKFDKISASLFAKIEDVNVITDTNIPKAYKKLDNIIIV